MSTIIDRNEPNPSATAPSATINDNRPTWRGGAFLIISLLLGMTASATEVKTKAGYVINLAGINIANLNIDFVDDGQKFSVNIGAAVSGIGTIVAKGTASAASSGSSRSNALAPTGFNLATRANGEDFSVEVAYTGGDATGFRVVPPLINNVGRVALERKHLRGVSDPLAAFILKGDALDPKLCDRRLKIFTGMERYDLDMSFAAAQTATSRKTGYQGPVILCRVRYVPVSGHFKSSEMTAYLAKSDKILIWYAPLPNSNYFIPYRVLMGTSVGDLSMVLTNLK